MKTIPPIEIVGQGVEQFADSLRAETAAEHPYVQAAVDSYLDVLECGGKRTRGTLAVHGYELFDGQDTEVITAAAGAIEGLHAYLLVVDDVADHALTRRGQPAAHVAIAELLREQGFTDDGGRIAEDLAIAAALTGQHHAQDIFASLDIPPAQRLAGIMNVNRHLRTTGMGQILDIASTTGMQMSEEDILIVAARKTAHYSFQLPLETGALLAGADTDDLKPLAGYSYHAGVAFQLQDDILGLFGDQATIGKSAKSDLVEGKQTFLMHHALASGDDRQQERLRGSLGNRELTDEDFEACKQIVVETGALAAVEARAAYEADQAQAVLDDCPAEWPVEKVEQLRHMVAFAITRTS